MPNRQNGYLNLRFHRNYRILCTTVISVFMLYLFSAEIVFADNQSYSLHIGSYKIEKNAMNVVSNVKSKGYASFVKTKKDSIADTVWHQVLVGHYTTKEAAKKELLQLKKDKVSNYYVIVPASDNTVGSAKSVMTTGYGQKKSALSLSITSGWSFLPKVDDFSVSQTGSPDSTWSIRDDATGFAGIDINWNFFNAYSLQGGIKTEMFENIDLYYFELGPKISTKLMENLDGFLRTGIVYGYFDWDDVPGDFDDSLGWLIGAGITYSYKNFLLGLDIFYRNIDFHYSAPNGMGVTSSHNNIDFSGTLITGKLGYQF